jgi:eukaryotic-like serine/threonine-protein kinase
MCRMKFVFESGPIKGSKYNLEGVVSVGRAPGNDIVIEDGALSLVHCRIHVKPKTVLIVDLGSTNGTWVNGERIVSADLDDGDSVVMGTCKARVQIPFRAPSGTIINKEPGDADGGDLSGDIFGTVMYSLNRKIADGGMGAIYEAQQFGAEGFIKRVAIKTILPKFAQRESLIAAFVGEARLVANLVHQNIVQIHHLGRHEGGYYIAMEYINGLTLTNLMAMHVMLTRQVPVDLAMFIVSRIARGLEYAHNKHDSDGSPLNLVHRDVSPNNIMIDVEGEVKLTDFGVAKASQFMREEEGELVGCVEFMSPEQARCDAVDARSDVFSLGLVFYELLTGTRLFRCEDGDVARAIEAVELASVPDARRYRPEIPDSVAEIVSLMLRKHPDDRYQSAGALSRALEENMYGGGYGPTVVKLATYVDELTRQTMELKLGVVY